MRHPYWTLRTLALLTARQIHGISEIRNISTTISILWRNSKPIKNHIPAMIQRICIKSWDSNVNNLSNTCLLASTFSKWLQNITLWKWHSLHNLSEMEGWNKTTMIITNPKSNDRTIKGRPSFTAFSYLSLRCCIPFQVLPKYILSYMTYIYF